MSWTRANHEPSFIRLPGMENGRIEDVPIFAVRIPVEAMMREIRHSGFVAQRRRCHLFGERNLSVFVCLALPSVKMKLHFNRSLYPLISHLSLIEVT